jgi:hypothetical protein
MGGHNIVVGKGRFIRHLVPKPTPKQRREHHVAKAAKTATPVVLKTRVMPGQVPKKPAPAAVQKSLSDQKTDLLAYLERQHDTWVTQYTQWHLAINQAENHFRDVMDQKTPPPLGVAILVGAFQTLVFVAIPALGPIKEVAEKLSKHAQVLEKTADAVCELTKMTIEKVKADMEFADAQDEKTRTNSMAIKFFDQKYTMVGEHLNAVSKTWHELSKYLTTGDGSDLVTRLPAVRAAWTKSTWERPDNDADQIHADQLALLLLYDLMRQYCASCVELKGAKRPEGAAAVIFTQPQDMFGTISKEDFYRYRQRDDQYDCDFEGLDSARRAKMYEYFKEIRWQLGSRPVPLTWLQLIDFWDFKG